MTNPLPEDGRTDLPKWTQAGHIAAYWILKIAAKVRLKVKKGKTT